MTCTMTEEETEQSNFYQYAYLNIFTFSVPIIVIVIIVLSGLPVPDNSVLKNLPKILKKLIIIWMKNMFWKTKNEKLLTYIYKKHH